MNHYSLAPMLLLDYAKTPSYNVFCSICSSSFSLVIDLQNHLSVHLHLDVELRGGLIHYDANLMSSSAYGNLSLNLNHNEDTIGTSHGIDKKGALDCVDRISEDEYQSIRDTERIIEEGDGSNSFPGASEVSEDFPTALDGTCDDTGTDSTEYNDSSYPNSVGFIKLELNELQDDSSSTTHIKDENSRGVLVTDMAGSKDSESTTETDATNNFSFDSDDPKDNPFVRNFECSSCGQKFVNLQSCLSHYSKSSCFRNGLEVVKVVEAKIHNEDSVSSVVPPSPHTPTYRCSTCDEVFCTIEEFSVHCRGHSVHKKFAVDFHRKPKQVSSPKIVGTKRKSTSSCTTLKKINKVVKLRNNESPKPALKDPFLYAFKEPDMLLCHTCNTQYQNLESCCDHLKNLNSKPLICAACGKLFKTEHVRDYHQKLPHVIPCSKCDVWFSDASSLSLHKKTHHCNQEKEKQ